ncbi:MAG TPA: NAD(P)H-dependent oxidoreductase [Burkholderiaceae bacterium]|nr:NAD(P)H-dependent oxidoreductase [Burkholderiaceae bacterium]
MNILQINSSDRPYDNGHGSQSTRLANELVARLVAADAQAKVTVRDLARQPHPALDEGALQALFTPAEAHTPEQAARVALDDLLIAEAKAADVVVLGVPMYNFGVSAQLKNWTDAIARARVTFEYTPEGPHGLLTGKKVYALLTRGGKYRDTPQDSQVPYLKMVLCFLGMTNVEFIFAEGLNMGPDAEAVALTEAWARIEEAVSA